MGGPADLVAWWRNSSKNRVIQQFTAVLPRFAQIKGDEYLNQRQRLSRSAVSGIGAGGRSCFPYGLQKAATHIAWWGYAVGQRDRSGPALVPPGQGRGRLWLPADSLPLWPAACCLGVPSGLGSGAIRLSGCRYSVTGATGPGCVCAVG